MPSFSPFAALSPGAKVPQDLPKEVALEGGYVGLVSRGRVYYAAVDESGSIYLDDRRAKAYRYQTAVSLEATFSLLSLYEGTKLRFVSSDGELPAALKPFVTKGEVRRPEPFRVSDELVRKILRAGGEDISRAQEAFAGIADKVETIERNANWVGSRASGREILLEQTKEALEEQGYLPAPASPTP